MNQQKEYIPGFDCAKLLGCICVAASHLLPEQPSSLPPVVASAFSGIVPLFFLMSGYLMKLSVERKSTPLPHLHRYLMRYGLVYFSLNLVANIIHYARIYMQSGILMINDFLLVTLTTPLWQVPLYQLWFIPSLMLGMWCGVHAFMLRKEKLWGLALIPLTVVTLLFSTYGVSFFGISASGFSYPYHAVVPLHFVEGLAFVYLGMLMASRRQALSSPKAFWLPALLVLFAEDHIVRHVFHIEQISTIFTFSQCIFAVAIFRTILCLPGQFLRNYHRLINRFTLLIFLLHPLQIDFFRTWIPNPYLLFPIIICVNLILAYAFPYLFSRKAGVHHGL